MDLINNLSLGFSVAFTMQNLMYAFIGCFLGTLIGVLPGVGPVATIAMLLPATYALPPVAALIMLAGIYYGAQYGGSTTAILVNLPGESSSVVTVIDGYQMARKGRAGPALAAAGLGSFFAGSVGTLILAAFAPPLTEVAFKFGPAEYFSLMVLGLIGAVVLASGSLLKAITMILLGLALGLVGTDVNSGVARFSFDMRGAYRLNRGALTGRAFNRYTTQDDGSSEVRVTGIGFGVIRDLNEVARVNVDFAVAREADIDDGSSTGDDDPDTTNTSASISLSYDLTQTVTTEVGYGYRSEVQDPTDAESHRVFFTIGREFSAGL